MKIIKAESAGFCFGVERAVSLATEAAKSGDKIATLGELIHNQYVNDYLQSKGINIKNSIDDFTDETIIIRSHGVGKDIYEKINQKNLKLIDTTCTNVKSIQNTAKKYYSEGYSVIIVGDETHPEVIGVNGWCENNAFIINNISKAESIDSEKPVCVVAQTTIIKNTFDDICRVILKKYPEAIVFNTICSATSKRQLETENIAKTSDAMIIIGGKNSSNTRKLVEISMVHCNRVFHIESAAEINYEQLSECEILGITAGASTPTQIILEVISKMDDTMENFEKSLDDLRQIRVGDVITGEIISVNEDELYVNINYKSDGIIKKADFLMDLYSDLTTSAAIGDTVEAMVTEMNDGTGNVVLSKIKVDEITAFNEAEEKYKNGESLNGKITKIVKGGVLVDLGFTRAFMPGNQYALKYTEDLNVLLGKEVEGRIIEFDKDKNKIIFSRKILLQEEKNAQREERERKRNEAIETLEIDQIITAPVKNIADFGIFLDLDGVDGFIHVSDLSWKRISNPKSFCKTGDMIEAKIIELNKETFKIKLSIKALTKEPWLQFTETYKVGDTVNVTIKSLVKFGAFAEILPTVEGLIHISNISHDKVASAESVLSIGEELTAKIIEIDTEKHKIGLSIKDLSEAPKRKIESDKLYYKEESNVTMEDIFKNYLEK